MKHSQEECACRQNHRGQQRAPALPPEKQLGADRTDRKDKAVMGNRKLPFGYQMRMGEIIRNEYEAKAVQDIFLLREITSSLQSIRL